MQQEKQHVKDLERELARKDKALVAAALLILRKEAVAIWGDARSGLPDRTEPLRGAGSLNDQHPGSPE